jgi:hypothetical protein
MSNSFIYNDEDDVNELYSEEEEEQEEIDDRGVSEIYEDEEFERQNTDNVILSDFPKLDSILAEGRNFDDIPEGLNARQEDIYRKGIKLVKDINKRCKCRIHCNRHPTYIYPATMGIPCCLDYSLHTNGHICLFN